MPLGGPSTQHENEPLTSRYIRTQQGKNLSSLSPSSSLRSSLSSSLGSIRSSDSLRKLERGSPKGTLTQIESGPGFSMPTTRRRSPTQLGQIGRRHQNIKDVQNTVSQARAMVGQMKQEREKNNLINPTAPSSPRRRSASFSTRRRKTHVDQLAESRRRRTGMRDTAAGIKKTKKMKKRKRTKRKQHKKKHRKSKGGSPPGQNEFTSELPFWKSWGL
jgi:hypothetical protein